MNNKATGQTIREIAASIAKDIYPGGAALMDELNQTIASNVKLSGSLHNENLQKSLASMFQGANIPEAEALRMARSVNAKNYTQAIEGLRGDVTKYSDKPVDKVLERAKVVTEKEMQKSIDPSALSIPDKIIKYPGAYFMNPDKRIRNTRIAAAAGAYAGVAVGGRYLSGGTLTTDQYGRKDIAGVPFL